MSDNVRHFDPRKIQTNNELFGAKRRFNPRTLSNPGFAPEQMDRLRTGISKDGLNHALLVMILKGIPVLIAGERRLRAILGLMEADEKALKEGGERILVKNPISRKMEPALDVFSKVGVECKIADAVNEQDALRQAIQENTLHEELTDFEMLMECDLMEKAGIPRAEQAAIIGFSEAWISQSHSLLNSHPDILKYMERGQLNRTAAITFLKVEEDKIAPTLRRAVDLTYSEAEDKEIQAIKELEEAKEDLQRGQDELTLSNFTGNHESARKARRHVARAGGAVDKASKKVKAAQLKKKKKISVETINKAARDVNADGNLNRPQSMKNVRLICDEIEGLLKSSEDVVLVHPENKKEYDRRDIEIVHNVLEWQLSRNDLEHPLDAVLLVRHGKKAGKKQKVKV